MGWDGSVGVWWSVVEVVVEGGGRGCWEVVRGGIGAGFGFGWCRDLSVPGEFL